MIALAPQGSCSGLAVASCTEAFQNGQLPPMIGWKAEEATLLAKTQFGSVGKQMARNIHKKIRSCLKTGLSLELLDEMFCQEEC